MSELTLTDFLLARIAEDEAVARAAVIPKHDGPDAYKPHPELRAWQYAPWTPYHLGDQSGEVEYVRTPEMLTHKYDERIYVTCDSEGLSPSVAEDVGPHIARHDPDRVLAECEAKRRIVEAATDYSPELEHGDNGEWAFDVALRMLALPYADHPDYREEWKRWAGHRAECHCLDCGKDLPVETGPSRKIAVRRAHVYAARARVDLDRQSGRDTEGWIKQLAETEMRP